MNFLESFVARARLEPDADALVSQSQRLSYRQLLTEVHSLAQALGEAGVGRGDVVVMLMAGRAEQLRAAMALAWIGAISISPTLGSAGVDDVLRAAGARTILHSAEPAILASLPPMRAIDLRSLRHAGPPEVPLADMAASDIWRIGMSSGTTGASKGIRLSVGAHMEKIRFACSFFGLDRDDRVMIATSALLPAVVGYWCAALSQGGCVLLPPGDAAGLCQMLHEERASFVFASPDSALRMLEVARVPGSAYARPAPALRKMCVGGGVVAPPLRELLRRHFTTGLQINYGTGEAGPIAFLDEHLQQSHPDCAGRVCPTVEVQAVGDDGQALAPGETGRLKVRSGMVASGYVGAVAQSSTEGFHDGWFRTSDRGRVTQDGLVYLEGRLNEVINQNGRKASAASIEAAIAEDPVVTECAVLQMLRPSGQSVLVAVVVAAPGFDAEAARQRCAARFGRLLVPHHFVFAPRLPRNPAGKVMRDVLMSRVKLT